MENLQQFQQAIQQPMVPALMSGANQFNQFGKVVESVDIVKVTDIPMDGNVYYFPKADGTEIYSKQFMVNGQTRILTFKPVLEDNPNTLSNEDEKLKISALENVTALFQEKFDTINDKIDKIEKYLKPVKAKKEVDTDA
jgi:hypothetical protein